MKHTILFALTLVLVSCANVDEEGFSALTQTCVDSRSLEFVPDGVANMKMVPVPPTEETRTECSCITGEIRSRWSFSDYTANHSKYYTQLAHDGVIKACYAL